MKIKYPILALLMMTALLLTGCGSDDKKDKTANDADSTVEITDDEKVPDDEVVAEVNGTEILGKTYNIVYAQLKLHTSQTGQEVDLDKLKENTMVSVIDRELLMQQAEKEGIEISDKKADKELDEIKENNKDGLKTILEQYQMSEEDFKEQLKFELALVEYKDKAIEVQITDKELEEYYNKAKENNEDIPELDEIKPQLKEQMEVQKENEAVQEKIDEAKKAAKIEQKKEV